MDGWIAAYRQRRPVLETYTSRLTDLIGLLLNDAGIDAEVSGRTKELASFRQKLERKGGSYTNPLVEVTDLVGLRVITYYIQDIRLVRDLLDQNFDIDWANSFATNYDDPERFGYASDHYVIRLSADRSRSRNGVDLRALAPRCKCERYFSMLGPPSHTSLHTSMKMRSPVSCDES